MAVNFPTELQQKMNQAGFSFNIGSTTLRSKMDVGEEKIRRRVTRGIDKQALTIDLEFSDYQVLYDFYNTTLNGGVERFTFEDPFTHIESTYRFLSPPAIASKGALWFTVTMNWEKMS